MGLCWVQVSSRLDSNSVHGQKMAVNLALQSFVTMTLETVELGRTKQIRPLELGTPIGDRFHATTECCGGQDSWGPPCFIRFGRCISSLHISCKRTHAAHARIACTHYGGIGTTPERSLVRP